jgi:hypothetical protein
VSRAGRKGGQLLAELLSPWNPEVFKSTLLWTSGFLAFLALVHFLQDRVPQFREIKELLSATMVPLLSKLPWWVSMNAILPYPIVCCFKCIAQCSSVSYLVRSGAVHPRAGGWRGGGSLFSRIPPAISGLGPNSWVTQRQLTFYKVHGDVRSTPSRSACKAKAAGCRW